MWFLGDLQSKTTFITGSSKNAGKTTFLNLVAKELRKKGPVGLLSIGVDGEGRDLVFGNPKPLIFLEQGDIVATTNLAINASAGMFRILDVFPVKTALGRVVLAQALRGDSIELVGPETNSQLEQCLQRMRDFDASSILVDGAVNRVTQIAAASDAGFVDVIKLNPSTREAAEERLRFLSIASEISLVPREFENALPHGWIEFQGAVTESRLAGVQKDCAGIVVPHLAALFAPSKTLSRFQQRLFVRKRFEIHAVIVNGWDVDEIAFVRKCSSLALHSRIWINPYKEASA